MRMAWHPEIFVGLGYPLPGVEFRLKSDGVCAPISPVLSFLQ